MVNCEQLYTNDSVQGTLHLVIDNSKFDIKFYKSLSVELSLSEENNLSEQCHETQILTSTEYFDLSKEKSYEGIPKTSQKVLEVIDGQVIPIVPLDEASPARKKCHKRKNSVASNSLFPSGSKQRKIRENEDILSQDSEESYENLGENEAETEIENNENFNPVAVVKCEVLESLQEPVDQSIVVPKLEETLIHAESGDRSYPVTVSITTRAVEEGTDQDDNDKCMHYCRDCCRNFKTSKALKDHRKVKIVTEFSCDACLEVFPFKGMLEVHKKSHHSSSGATVVFKDKQYWYSCDTCGTLVKSLLKLELHNLSHTGEGYYQCCLCPEKFGHRIDLSKHVKTHCHSSSGLTRCRWCNQWFPSKTALGRHKMLCKEIRCHICGTVFSNSTSRNFHYKKFHPMDILKCEICNRMFSTKEDLDLHMENHSKLKKEQCPLCGLFYSRLKKHMRIHKNPSQVTEDEMFYCDKCPAKFTSKSSFNRHMSSHTGLKPYQCPHCPKTFSCSGALYKHLKRFSNFASYACEVCGQNYESLETFKEHMMTHSDSSNPFPCALCPQSFLYRISLESHMREKHPEFCATNGINSTTTVSTLESLDAVRQISNVEAAHQEMSTGTAYTTSQANSLLEVVIPALASLSNANCDPRQFEIVVREVGCL